MTTEPAAFTLPAREIRAGLVLDLGGDPYAANKDDPDGGLYTYEYAYVLPLENDELPYRAPGAVLLHVATSGEDDVISFPADHPLRVVGYCTEPGGEVIECDGPRLERIAFMNRNAERFANDYECDLVRAGKCSYQTVYGGPGSVQYCEKPAADGSLNCAEHRQALVDNYGPKAFGVDFTTGK